MKYYEVQIEDAYYMKKIYFFADSVSSLRILINGYLNSEENQKIERENYEKMCRMYPEDEETRDSFVYTIKDFFETDSPSQAKQLIRDYWDQ